MTEEEVVNVRGEEISENGRDHHKIRPEHCNGDAREKVKDENDNVGGEVDGEIVAVVDCGESDPIVTVDGNGAASEDRKVDGESRVVVTEGELECEVVDNNDKENDSAVSNGSAEGISKTTPVDVVEREGESGIVDGQNGLGSTVVSGDEKDVHVTDTVAEGGDECRSVQNGVLDWEQSECPVEEKITVTVGVTVVHDRELESVEVGASDVQNGVVAAENEICGDVDVIKGVAADVDKSDRNFDAVAIENGAVDRVEEIELSVVEEVPAATDGTESHDSDLQARSDAVSDKDHKSVGSENVVVDDSVSDKDHESLESEYVVVGDAVSDEDHESVESENVVVRDAVSDKDHESVEIENVELESVGGAEVSECAEKNEISVADNGVCDATDVKECAGEISGSVDGVCDVTDVKECVGDSQNGLEKVPGESVSGTDVQNGLAEVMEVTECAEENEIPDYGKQDGELERSEEGSGGEVVPAGEDLSSLNGRDIVGDDSVVSEGEPSVSTSSAVVNEANEAEPSVSTSSAVENEVEPSNDVVKGESEPSASTSSAGENEANEAEPSVSTSSVVENEVEPLINVVKGEIEPSVDVSEVSNDEVESEAEPLNNAVEPEVEPSGNAVLAEADSSVDVPDLKTDAVEREAEPLVEAEPSPEGEGSDPVGEDLQPTQEGSVADALDGQSMGTEVVRRPFYYLIRVPRYDDDENIKEKIKIALNQVDEKTKIRDAIRGESQTKRATCKEYGQELRSAIAEERAARDLLKSKRQEMDLVQSTMNRLNTAISVGDIDGKIRNMEHMIQHETLPLKEEKQLIRQIQQLKHNREELSAHIGKQDQSQSLDNIEEHSKKLQILKKELEVLRNNVVKKETATKAARKKYDEESKQLSELMGRFKAADDTRQETYVKLQTLKKQLHEKSKYFWEYKNAATKAQELAAQGKKEELQSFCIDQEERITKLWNNNDEFRRNYIRCNTRSTLRRLQTLDGRSLGPDEEPPVIPNAFPERVSKNNSSVLGLTLEQEKKSASTEPVNIKDEPVSKVVVQKTEGSQTNKAKKPAKPAPSVKSVVAVTRWGDESDEDIKEEPVRTKEEEERILKADKARKEEEAAKLKEMRRLEEIEKAKEALQRKKRIAEKAQQRAAYKAQKEAEQKEKEREKRARKKEKRNVASTAEAGDNIEQDDAPSTEILTRATEECDQSEKLVEVAKRPQKPSQFTKQNKVKSVPMSIRNRGKRRIQPWMWALIAVLIAVALFYMGNNSFLRSSMQSFGF